MGTERSFYGERGSGKSRAGVKGVLGRRGDDDGDGCCVYDVCSAREGNPARVCLGMLKECKVAPLNDWAKGRLRSNKLEMPSNWS